MAPNVASPSSFAFGQPFSGRNNSVEFAMVATDANHYYSQADTLRLIEARLGALTSDISDITEKLLAQGGSLDATNKLAQDSMDSVSYTRMLLQGMSETMSHVDDDVAVLKLNFEAMKIVVNDEARKREEDRHILMEIRDAILGPRVREM